LARLFAQSRSRNVRAAVLSSIFLNQKRLFPQIGHTRGFPLTSTVWGSFFDDVAFMIVVLFYFGYLKIKKVILICNVEFYDPINYLG
jgi:hypothetical protein